MNYEDRKRRARMDDESPKRRKRREGIPEDYDNDDVGDDHDDEQRDEGHASVRDDGNLN